MTLGFPTYIALPSEKGIAKRMRRFCVNDLKALNREHGSAAHEKVYLIRGIPMAACPFIGACERYMRIADANASTEGRSNSPAS